MLVSFVVDRSPAHVCLLLIALCNGRNYEQGQWQVRPALDLLCFNFFFHVSCF